MHENERKGCAEVPRERKVERLTSSGGEEKGTNGGYGVASRSHDMEGETSDSGYSFR